jgi:hypothetical protein
MADVSGVEPEIPLNIDLSVLGRFIHVLGHITRTLNAFIK